MSWWNDGNWLGQPQDAYANMAEDLVNAVNERLNYQFPGYQLPTVADFKELRRDAAWLPAIIKELQDTLEVMLSPTKSYSPSFARVSFLWTTPTAYADEAALGPFPPPPWTMSDWRVHTALYGCLQWDELLAAIEVGYEWMPPRPEWVPVHQYSSYARKGRLDCLDRPLDQLRRVVEQLTRYKIILNRNDLFSVYDSYNYISTGYVYSHPDSLIHRPSGEIRQVRMWDGSTWPQVQYGLPYVTGRTIVERPYAEYVLSYGGLWVDGNSLEISPIRAFASGVLNLDGSGYYRWEAKDFNINLTAAPPGIIGTNFGVIYHASSKPTLYPEFTFKTPWGTNTISRTQGHFSYWHQVDNWPTPTIPEIVTGLVEHRETLGPFGLVWPDGGFSNLRGLDASQLVIPIIHGDLTNYLSYV